MSIVWSKLNHGNHTIVKMLLKYIYTLHLYHARFDKRFEPPLFVNRSRHKQSKMRRENKIQHSFRFFDFSLRLAHLRNLIQRALDSRDPGECF